MAQQPCLHCAEEAFEDKAFGVSVKPLQKQQLSRKTQGHMQPACADEPGLVTTTGECSAGNPLPLIFPGKLLVESPKWARVEGKSKVLHVVEGLAQPTSATWRTKRGWPFARNSHFTLFSSPAAARKSVKCRMSSSRASAASHVKSGKADAKIENVPQLIQPRREGSCVKLCPETQRV